MVTETEAEESLHYILDHSEGYATARARVKGLEYILKVKEAEGFKDAKGNIEERKAFARTTTEYHKAVDEYEEAWYDFTLLETRINHAQLVIDMFRTQESSRRKG